MNKTKMKISVGVDVLGTNKRYMGITLKRKSHYEKSEAIISRLIIREG